ncbi:dihydroflavonol-4-reductase [Kaistia hirudinis]|uniref:Dihydroflavonol-4-reductase n=1 Tax=Kaistia hirudinis TaxID=1293440 RepID=A0A840AJ71_9HYPH|nr:NAD-dependent epimerase/dehydratase family protein [Kaistia hirudinis]MBB3929458.1 dihydroflavonol-4-reductase [Kaistia hirudinis]
MIRSSAAAHAGRIVVTGASGHLGGWIVAILRERGFAVRGTAGPGEDLAVVRERLAAGGVDVGHLDLCSLDLLSDDDLGPLMAGADALIHVAAPIPLHLPEASPSMLKAAREGTRRILDAAAKAGTRRVVATSSIMAAVYGPHSDRGNVLTEQDWSAPAEEPMTAYAVAKTEAEREAWRVADALALDFTSINPGVLLGPGLTGTVSASLNVFQEALAGRATIAPRVLLPVADVRDVARLHVDALSADASIGERIFCVSEQIWLIDLIEMIRAAEPGLSALPVPRLLKDELARKIADSFSMLRYLRYDIGEGRPIARDKATSLLGAAWRPLDATVSETIGYLRSVNAALRPAEVVG